MRHKCTVHKEPFCLRVKNALWDEKIFKESNISHPECQQSSNLDLRHFSKAGFLSFFSSFLSFFIISCVILSWCLALKQLKHLVFVLRVDSTLNVLLSRKLQTVTWLSLWFFFNLGFYTQKILYWKATPWLTNYLCYN